MLLLRLPDPDRRQIFDPVAQPGVVAAPVLLRLVGKRQQVAVLLAPVGVIAAVVVVAVVVGLADDHEAVAVVVVVAAGQHEPERLPRLMEKLQKTNVDNSFLFPKNRVLSVPFCSF